MLVRAVDITEVGGRIDSRRARNAHAAWTERRGLQLAVHTANGSTFLGEASPLPGYSPDTLAECARALKEVPWSGLAVHSIADVEAWCATISAPAARFAAETALFGALAETEGRAVAELLARHEDLPVRAAASLCALITDPLDRAGALAEVADAWARDVRAIKVKIGRPGRFADELTLLRDIRARHGIDLAIRLDVNQAWTRTEAIENLPALVAIAPEYVEEPCPDWHRLASSPVPLAADESLIPADESMVGEILAAENLAAVILKPMVLGGLLPCLLLARRARERGLLAVPSHLFDGPVAMAAYTQLALVLGGTCGLDRHVGLDAWPARPVPGLRAARIEAVPRASDSLSIRRAAEQYGDRPFLRYPGGIVSYRQMANRVAASPASAGERMATVVAERTPDTVARILYEWENERPVALMHPRSTTEERARWAALTDQLAADLDLDGARADLVLFTSGSSGDPKAVVIDRFALCASADASGRHLGWRDDDRWLCCLPLSHIGGLAIVIRCLLAGASVVLVPEGSFDARRLARTIAQQRVTLLSLVPTMLARLLDLDWTPPDHLRAVLIGGAATAPALYRRAHERGVPALVTYGMTETCSQIATQALVDGRPASQEQGHIGPLLAGVEVETRTGRLWVRSPGLCRGYLGTGATRGLDRARFDARGFFDTGDCGFVDENNHLHVHGRADSTIITGGENVDPGEVENVLCRHPDIVSACVFGVPDPIWGELVAAAVVCAPTRSLDLGQLASFLKAELPAHKRPRRLCQLPTLRAKGQLKVRRRDVAARALPRLQSVSYGRPGE